MSDTRERRLRRRAAREGYVVVKSRGGWLLAYLVTKSPVSLETAEHRIAEISDHWRGMAKRIDKAYARMMAELPPRGIPHPGGDLGTLRPEKVEEAWRRIVGGEGTTP